MQTTASSIPLSSRFERRAFTDSGGAIDVPERELARFELRASSFVDSYLGVRERTEALVRPIGAEDMVVQSMPDCSPAKWHLAHVTWFFESFLLAVHSPDYRVFNQSYGYLFNSYYEALGSRQPRAQRGLLTRPALLEVMAYRRYVDEHMVRLLQFGVTSEIVNLVRLGLAHEEQ